MKKLLYLMVLACTAFLISISFDAFVMSSFWVSPNPQYSFTIGGVTTSDIFIFGMPDEDLVFTEVEGILFSGTEVQGRIDKCDSNGSSCSTLISGLIFNGGRDTYNTFTSSTISANETLKWITTSATAAGYLTVSLRYYPSGS